MKIIKSIEEMREYSQQCKRDGKTIASIATEGELHDGHMSLVKIAKENVDVTVLSICHTFDYLENSTEKYETQVKTYEQSFKEKEKKKKNQHFFASRARGGAAQARS